MTVLYSAGYTLPGPDYSLKNARILHAGNWLTTGTYTASTTATGYFAVAPGNSLTYERWKATAIPAQLTVTFGGAQSITCAAVAAHTLAGDTVALEYWTGAAWAVVVAAAVIPDNSPIMWIFPARSATQFRLNISAAPAIPEVGVFMLGNPLQMPVSIYAGHAPIDFGRQTALRSNRSDTGEYLGRTKQRAALTTDFEWTHLPRSWVLANWKLLQTSIEAEPFFLAWRPLDWQSVGYCQTDQTPGVQNMGVLDFMSASLSVRGLADYG